MARLSAVAGRHGRVGFASRNPCRVHRVWRRDDHGPERRDLWASLLMAPAPAARRRRLTRRGPRSRPRSRAGAIRLGRDRRSVSACRGSSDGHALRHRGCHGFAPDGFMPATLPRPDRPGATRPGPRRRTRSGWGDVADGRRSCGRMRRCCTKAVFGPGLTPATPGSAAGVPLPRRPQHSRRIRARRYRELLRSSRRCVTSAPCAGWPESPPYRRGRLVPARRAAATDGRFELTRAVGRRHAGAPRSDRERADRSRRRRAGPRTGVGAHSDLRRPVDAGWDGRRRAARTDDPGRPTD